MTGLELEIKRIHCDVQQGGRVGVEREASVARPYFLFICCAVLGIRNWVFSPAGLQLLHEILGEPGLSATLMCLRNERNRIRSPALLVDEANSSSLSAADFTCQHLFTG